MNYYKLCVITEEMAKEICTWNYPNEYSVYNLSDWDTSVQFNLELTIKEKRELEYVGFLLLDELIAFGRIFQNDPIVFIGIGLKPSYCDKGQGKYILKMLITEAKKRFTITNKIALEVRCFNYRAIKCYQNIGFKIEKQFCKTIFNENVKYFYMEYQY